jgi:hypothetical protein
MSRSMLVIGSHPKVTTPVAPEWQLSKACEGLLAIAMKTGVGSGWTRKAPNETTIRLYTSTLNHTTLPN